jgi:hypothetical protein
MDSESAKPNESEKHKQLDREIKDMVTAMTHRVSDFHKSGSSNLQDQDDLDDDHGVRIITLAGTNTGATMRSELDEKPNPADHGFSFGEPEPLSTYVNSNFQAINNSIMMGGSYASNDPGVHLDISDFFERKGHKPDKRGKKLEKKRDKENLKSDHTPDHSD